MGCSHYSDVMMGVMASQITSHTIVYSTVYSSADQRKHQSSAPLAFVWGIHRWSVNSPHKWPVARKMFPFDDVIMVNVLSECPSSRWGPWSVIDLEYQHRHIAIRACWCAIYDILDTCQYRCRYRYGCNHIGIQIHIKTCCKIGSSSNNYHLISSLILISLWMMTSSNGNIICHLCGEFTGRGWIPLIEASAIAPIMTSL